MNHLKNFKIFVNENIKPIRHFRYIDIEELPNGLKISLNEEGKIKATEDVLTEDNFDDYFDDVRGNSEYNYIYNLGEAGFGLTEAPGIVDGYYTNDDGYLTDDGRDDSKVYYYNDYMLKDFTKELSDNGFVIFTKA